MFTLFSAGQGELDPWLAEHTVDTKWHYRCDKLWHKLLHQACYSDFHSRYKNIACINTSRFLMTTLFLLMVEIIWRWWHDRSINNYTVSVFTFRWAIVAIFIGIGTEWEGRMIITIPVCFLHYCYTYTQHFLQPMLWLLVKLIPTVEVSPCWSPQLNGVTFRELCTPSIKFNVPLDDIFVLIVQLFIEG